MNTSTQESIIPSRVPTLSNIPRHIAKQVSSTVARIELSFPDDAFCFETLMQVRTTDINGANHLGNDALVSMLSEARAQFLIRYDLPESDSGGAGIIVTDLATMYQAESFFPEMLRFEVGVMDFNKYGGDFVFRVTKVESGQAVALAKYGFVFFDYLRKKVVPIPESFRSRFA